MTTDTSVPGGAADIKANVKSLSGEDVGEVSLSHMIFGESEDEAVPSLVHGVVVWQRNAKRAGTHSTISRGNAERTDKKPWRQKGSGRARAGTRNSPIWVGGAVAHGPKPRSYETRVSKRSRTQALVSVLSTKARAGSPIVLESFDGVSGKTRDFASTLKNLGIACGGCLVVADVADARVSKVARASRNIPGVQCVHVDGVNVFDVLKHDKLLCSKETLLKLEERVGRQVRRTTISRTMGGVST